MDVQGIPGHLQQPSFSLEDARLRLNHLVLNLGVQGIYKLYAQQGALQLRFNLTLLARMDAVNACRVPCTWRAISPDLRIFFIAISVHYD